MPTALIDGIRTRYEVHGSGPPLLMFSPGGFDATLEKWSTLGVYARIRLMDHLVQKYSCIVFDRRETGQSGGRVERVTWADYVAQGKGLLDHLNIAQAHLMGGCMGCSPVVAFGAMHPQATLSMVLYWPVGVPSTASAATSVSPSIWRLSTRMACQPSPSSSRGTESHSMPIRAAGHGPPCCAMTERLPTAM